MATRNVASITINLSLLSTSGGLHQVKDASSERDTRLVMVCPECKASTLDQVYVCKHGHKPSPNAPGSNPNGWTPKEIPDRAKVIGRAPNQQLVPVTVEERQTVTQPSIPPGVMDIDVVPASQLETVTWPAGNTYCFVPDKVDKVYTMLLKAASNGDTALIGVINMRGNEKLYRLVTAADGTLRVQELLRPEETATFAPAQQSAVSAAEQQTFEAIVDTLKGDFDVDAYSNSKLAGLRDLINLKQGTAGQAAPVVAKRAPTATTLDDQLQAALALAQAAKVGKAPAKKAAVKKAAPRKTTKA